MAARSIHGALDGNRIWRVPDPDGPWVQKLYAPRKRFPHRLVRNLGTLLFPAVTSATAEGRWRTERELLSRWREAGIDVPRDVTGEHPELAGPRVNVLEYVDGAVLGKLLRDPDMPREERDDLLRRFAAVWGVRHDLALREGRSDLVQAHATILHVLVAGDRLVTFDLERYQRSRNVLPLLAKEIGGYLRSLMKQSPEEVFRRDLVAIVEGYPRPDLLRDVLREVRRSESWIRRLVWALDRRRKRRRPRHKNKYVAIDKMGDALEAAATRPDRRPAAAS